MFRFQALSDGKGTKPFRPAPWPSDMLPQEPFCAGADDTAHRMNNIEIKIGLIGTLRTKSED